MQINVSMTPLKANLSNFYLTALILLYKLCSKQYHDSSSFQIKYLNILSLENSKIFNIIIIIEKMSVMQCWGRAVNPIWPIAGIIKPISVITRPVASIIQPIAGIYGNRAAFIKETELRWPVFKETELHLLRKCIGRYLRKHSCIGRYLRK